MLRVPVRKIYCAFFLLSRFSCGLAKADKECESPQKWISGNGTSACLYLHKSNEPLTWFDSIRICDNMQNALVSADIIENAYGLISDKFREIESNDIWAKHSGK